MQAEACAPPGCPDRIKTETKPTARFIGTFSVTLTTNNIRARRSSRGHQWLPQPRKQTPQQHVCCTSTIFSLEGLVGHHVCVLRQKQAHTSSAYYAVRVTHVKHFALCPHVLVQGEEYAGRRKEGGTGRPHLHYLRCRGGRGGGYNGREGNETNERSASGRGNRRWRRSGLTRLGFCSHASRYAAHYS